MSEKEDSKRQSVSDDDSEDRECLHYQRDLPKDSSARNRLMLATAVCFGCMVIGVIGGILSNSIAILSDAAHMLSDFSSFLIGLTAIHLSQKSRSDRQTFGWHRAEILGSLMSLLLIWGVSGVLVFIAVRRIVKQDFEIESLSMAVVAVVEFVIGLVMVLILHPPSHTHSHSHSLPHEPKDHSDSSEGTLQQGGQKVHRNINIRAAFIHVVGDLVQNTGVLLASLIIYFKPTWKMADPICTLLFSLIVIFTTVSIFFDIVKVLLERTPCHLSHSNVSQSILSIPGVEGCHNLRLWSLTLGRTVATCHVTVRNVNMCPEVLESVHKVLKDEYLISEISVQVEVDRESLQKI